MTVLDAPTDIREAKSTTTSTRSMRLAYLTTEYPKVSHTFIRRELLALEAQGHTVQRLAIRDGGAAIADDLDREEHAKTFHCLNEPVFRCLMRTMIVGCVRPHRMMRALGVTWRMHRCSTRGLFRHAAYLVEAATLLREVERESVEHIHVHFGTNAAAVARLMRALGGPSYSMMIHGPGEFDDPRGFDLGGKVADAAFVTAISDYCSAQLRRWVDVNDWEKIHIVRCPVADHFLDAAAPIDPNSHSIVSVGRLTPQKGQILLVDAVGRLVREGVPVKLVLAGDGEMRPAIEARIRALDLDAHVRITGWVDEREVRRHLLESRGLVLPSFAEGLPVVIMEALALGRPCVSTQIAAIPELVRDGETGWLIPPANLDALVDAVRSLLTEEVDVLNEMGARGRERVMHRHRASREAATLGSIIERHAA